ncbi:MAG: ketoacyl-ACP synthase III [Spirochaetales bacterium]|nr:ketoacyl-ACP synthase III [Spirochaetales bacterium]
MESKARITALGAYVPEKKLTNFDLEKIVETTDEWIVQRTGIKERRISAEDEFALAMGYKAVLNLIETSGKSIDDVDIIIFCTFTPDYLTPSCAAGLHGMFDLRPDIGVIDMNAACAGFVWGLCTANAYITSGMAKKILVVGSEAITKVTNYKDRNTCILFGDGAGAVLVEYDAENPGFLGSYFGADGKSGDRLYCTNINKKIAGIDAEFIDTIWQDGRAVYNFAIRTVPAGVRSLLDASGLTVDDIQWFVPHSANARMIQSISEKLGFSEEKTLTSLEPFGNSSSGTIPLALWLAQKENKIKKGDLLALYGFGGGLNHAGAIVKWF